MSSLFTRNLKRHYPTVVSAKGAWVEDSAGARYLDGCSGAVAANLGHGLPEINAALAKQLDCVAFAHTSQFVSEAAMELAERLIKLAPQSFSGGKVYFGSGGSEAVETALKLARAHFVERDGTSNKTLFVSRWNSYHGSTFGAMSVTGHPARRKPYMPMLRDQPHISAAYPYRCQCGHGPGRCESLDCAIMRADELEAIINQVGAENVIGFIAEPVVGAALGAVEPHPAYWPRIREICTKYDVLLIADEVMTGLGRCATNFALDRWNVQPDVIVVGKGLAAGYMPLSAVIAAPNVVAPFLAENSSGAFEHGFTYSGHPLACAAGLAVSKYMCDHGVIKAVAGRSKDFSQRLSELAKYEFVGDVRACGFLGGIEFVADRATKRPFPVQKKFHRVIADAAFEAGLLVYPGAGFLPGGEGDHIIVAPPLNISTDDMDSLFTRLDKVFAQTQQGITCKQGP
jgi:adenosylmethionine-8-amino-7-oxononanoate aminotransferase